MAVPLECSLSNSEGSAGRGARVVGGFRVRGCRGSDFVVTNWNSMFEIWSSLLWVSAAWACTRSSSFSRMETHLFSIAGLKTRGVVLAPRAERRDPLPENPESRSGLGQRSQPIRIRSMQRRLVLGRDPFLLLGRPRTDLVRLAGDPKLITLQ